MQAFQEGRDVRPEDNQDEIDLHGLANGVHGGGVPADAIPVQLQVDVHYAGVDRFLLRPLEQVIGRVPGLTYTLARSHDLTPIFFQRLSPGQA